MGGPGVFISRPAMVKLCPNIDRCAKDVVSKEEDVELGRCVSKYVGIECSHAWEMMEIFFHAYEGHYSGEPFMDYPLSRDPNIKKAITLHPVKNPGVMYKIHEHFLTKELKTKRFEVAKETDFSQMVLWHQKETHEIQKVCGNVSTISTFDQNVIKRRYRKI